MFFLFVNNCAAQAQHQSKQTSGTTTLLILRLVLAIPGPNCKPCMCPNASSLEMMFVCLVCFVLCANSVVYPQCATVPSWIVCRVPGEPARTMASLTYLLLRLHLLYIYLFHLSTVGTGFSPQWLNKKTTDKWKQSVSPQLSLNELNGQSEGINYKPFKSSVGSSGLYL